MQFSIIVPVYNVAPYLEECLESVLHQTFTDWECICVDDGSTDGSGEILDAYAERDKRFRVFHQANAGVSAARNLALKHLTGEWICFLDGDDVWHPQVLALLQNAIKHHPNALLFKFGCQTFVDDLVWEIGDDKPITTSVNIAQSIEEKEFYSLCCQYCYAKTLFNGLTFPLYAYGEDRVVVSAILLNRVQKIISISAALYGYRQRPTSAIHKPPTERMLFDEMYHRRDILLMIESSPKELIYAGSYWLEGYFTLRIGELIPLLPQTSRKAVWKEWYGCIKEMSKAKGISQRTRRIYKLSLTFPWRWVWWVVICAWPRIRRRVASLLFYRTFKRLFK